MFRTLILSPINGIICLFCLLSFHTSLAQNPIVVENGNPGNPSTEWDITGAGDASIQGFSTDLSVDNGSSVHFKINVTDAAAYNIKIYRLGYYQGNGARLITDLGNFTGIIQPAPLTDPVTGLVDCGNWSVAASWAVPSNAVPGLYIARLTRTGNGGASHVPFVVRDDNSTADILFQTSDATWQAYNVWGGNSLYVGSTSYPSGHATKVSYNRPFVTRGGGGGSGASEDWLFHAEYPMIRWLERNGYNLNYATNIDVARNPNIMQPHKVFLSVGHDEYWSKEQRDHITAARNNGKHLAFFSGNEVYWKTRWENSIDGSGTPFRTLVCYKEGTQGENTCGGKCDPSPEWTGLWRDGCTPTYTPNDGCQPENALTGQISWLGANAAIEVPYANKDFRFWRHTSISSLAQGQTATLSSNTLGYELDWEQPNGHYPSGRILLSSTNVSGKTHKLSLYKHSSGAWVFGAGTVQWSWGLDGIHDSGNSTEDPRMQQATVNLFADMSVQPGSLQATLTATTASSDITAPVTTINTPAHNQTVLSGIPISISGTATDANAVAGTEISVDGGSSWLPANGTGQWSFTFTPTTAGTVIIKVRSFDDSGNMETAGAVPASNAIQLTVINAIAPTEGPGGPVLVISKTGNPFSRYPVEILRAQGLNAFSAIDISAMNSTVLNNHDVVLLGEMSLTGPEITLLTNWVNAGGTLIAFKPDVQLAGLLGITPTGNNLSDKYLLVNTSAGPGVGIVNQTIQFHGTADLYNLNGATSIATLYSDAVTATPYPAVTSISVGANGGSAVAFLYDLARSVVYTRQGNPAWSGDERDGINPLRSDDLFFGNKAGDVQNDWVDLSKVAIPQADEQMHLLTNIITQNNLHRKPLPRFWFLPKGLKAAIVMTGDDHGNNGTTARFNQYMALSSNNSPTAVTDWTAIRGTSYIYPNTPMSSTQATAFEGQGFEIALHLNTGCNNWTATSFQNDLTAQAVQFSSAFPGIAAPSTNRTHCIAWSDWSSAAEIQAANGIRLDVNYYYWPGSWVANRPGMFTGSGMPMRFAKTDGSIIDCYQVTTQMTDESAINYTSFCNALLDKAIGTEGYYGVFCANMHTDAGSSAGSDAIIASAQARQIPVISAKQMLNWLDGRNNSSFGSMNWSGHELSFSITNNAGLHQIKAMLPVVKTANASLSYLLRNGSPVPYTVQVIKGIAYAFFDATAGNYTAGYPVDNNPPVITAIIATPHTNGTATISWTTDENANSSVSFGLSAGNLNLSATDGAMVTSHSLLLTGLIPGNIYYFRVQSADGANNSTTEPLSPAAPLSFTMPNGVCASDNLFADFNQGTPDANTTIAADGDGAVSLKPLMQELFTGSSVPSGWSEAVWDAQPGASTTYSSGEVTVDGSHITYNTPVAPGTYLEFSAKFTAGNFQNIGFSGDADFNNPWVVIGRGSAGDNHVYARTSDGHTASLGSNLLDAMHTYRIEWQTGSGSFSFYVDGVLVPTPGVTTTVTGNMTLQISDYPAGGAALTVDWIKATPYAASGIFTSRVFDAGSARNWDLVNWNASVPANTNLIISVRKGNTPVPDGSWTNFIEISNGASVGCSPSQYIQYKATLSSTASSVSPVLYDLSIDCGNYPADNTGPVISNISISPNSNGTAMISWNTDEAANSFVQYGTVHNNLNQNSSDPALVTTHSITLNGLTPGSTYFCQIQSADCSGNLSTGPLRSFAIPFPSSNCFQDITSADFAQGTQTGTSICPAQDGAISLLPAISQPFNGPVLPADWQSFPWTGGSSTISYGSVIVDGARCNTVPATSTYGPGSSMEFSAIFGAGSFQHIGFGGGSDANGTGGIYNGDDPWAMFSTGSSTTVLKARVSPAPGTYYDMDIPGSYIGSSHIYRIYWKTNSIEFYIDGILVHTQAATISSPMRPAISDYNNGGAVVTVDWMEVSPYNGSGQFESRILDAGMQKQWQTASWNASSPAGTQIQIYYRVANSPAGISSAGWTLIPASGTSLNVVAQYIQYKAELTSTDPAVSPRILDISFQCSDVQWISISGNVWNDVDAMNDNMVNNSGLLQVPPNPGIPTGLRVYLVNTSTGLIEKSALVSPATNTYQLTNVAPNKTYRIYLSFVVYPTGTPESSIIPLINQGWEHTGQKNANPPNLPTGSDAVNDGKITVPAGIINLININFGIRVTGGDAVTG